MSTAQHAAAPAGQFAGQNVDLRVGERRTHRSFRETKAALKTTELYVYLESGPFPDVGIASYPTSAPQPPAGVSRLRIDLVTCVVINAFLIGVWAVTGFGYFWPGWVLAGWAVLLGLDAWGLFSRRPIPDNDIEQELRRLDARPNLRIISELTGPASSQ